jgi:hypothetical protein
LVPRQKVINAIDRVIRDTGEHVAQIAFRLDAIEFSGTYYRVNRRGSLAATVGAGKQIVLPAERYRSKRSFCRVVIDLDPAIVSVAGERLPSCKGIVDRTGQIGFFG